MSERYMGKSAVRSGHRWEDEKLVSRAQLVISQVYVMAEKEGKEKLLPFLFCSCMFSDDVGYMSFDVSNLFAPLDHIDFAIDCHIIYQYV